MSDFYNILGVDRNADQEEIKRAYRRLAAQHHPDRGGDTKKFQEIQAAYETLSDPQKKAQYDNPQPQMGGFPGGFHFHAGGGFPPGFEEIFGDAFGGMFRRQQKNKNLNIQTSISLEDALTGKNLMANINLPSGKEQLIDVKIPAGIQDGMTIRLAGLGDNSFPNLPRGDIHLTVHVQPHPIFQRQGDDLIRNFELNCLDAILGKNITIHTLDKKTLDVKIPPGTQHNQTFSFSGYGMPNVNDNRFKGRMLINIMIKVPTNLSEDKKELIKRVLN